MPASPVPYDAFADLYDVWVETAPVCRENRPFYVKQYMEVEGDVVELGVGTGRIAIEAARKGKKIIGVDSSEKMLLRAKQRAKEYDVSDKLTLFEADFREFRLASPASLITIPFHSIGHMVTRADRLAAFRQVYGNLKPGGKFIFDHFVFDEKLAAPQERVPRLRDQFYDPETGLPVLLWVTSVYQRSQRTMKLVVWTESLNEHGVSGDRHYRLLDFSWSEPAEFNELLQEAGFEILDCFGDFKGTPFDENSKEQVWVAQRPA